MRSTLVTALLGLSLLAACEVGSAGGGGGGGGGDDTTGGGGGGGGPDAAVAVPRLDVSIDKPSISTELGTTQMVTVTMASSGGFTGPVNLTATVVDAGGAAMPGWTVAFNSPMVTVPANGMATAVATVMIPTQNQGLAATVKLQAVSSLGTTPLTSAITALNQVTMTVTENAQGQCVYPTTDTMTVKAGTKVRFSNKFTTDNITIHSNGGAQGIAHEPDPGHAINTVYERTFSGTGTFDWYCHAPGPNLSNVNGVNKNPKFTVVP